MNQNVLNIATKVLRREEGFDPKPYLCSEGYVTVGIGTKLHNKKGMNPEDFCIHVDILSACALLTDEIDHINSSLCSRLGYMYQALDPNRKAILISMAYQMGVKGLIGFKMMLVLLENCKYKDASVEALDSMWALQTPERAARHAEVLRTGDLDASYIR